MDDAEFSEVVEEIKDEPSDHDKIDYLYQVALKLDELVSSITAEQVEQVRKVYHNPLLRKMLGG